MSAKKPTEAQEQKATEVAKQAPETAKPFNLSMVPIADIADEGKWMDLLHPDTSEKLNVRMRVHGTDSERVRAAENHNSKVVAQILKKRGLRTVPNPKEVEEGEVTLAVAAVSEWQTWEPAKEAWMDGLLIGEEKLDCNTTGKTFLFTDRNGSWILEQVRDFMKERGNFTSR